MTQKQWICLGLLALTLVTMIHVSACDFIHFDDPLYVTNNPSVLGGLTEGNLVWAFTDACHHAGFWFPLTWLSLQADATLFGSDGAWGFHLVNLLLHTASVVLIFLVLQRMTRDNWRSAAATALFAIHPLRVESVAWITERKDALSMLFVVLTVTAYAWYAERPSWSRYGVLFITYVLGLMSKITLVTLPFALLLLDYWPLQRLRFGQVLAPKATSWRRLVLEKLPLLAAAVTIALIDMHFVTQLGSVDETVPFGERLQVALCAYLQYLQKTFVPVNLAVLYPWESQLPQVYALMSAVMLLLISVGAFVLRRRVPAVLVGWLWFLATLIPFSGIVQVGPQTMADRFTYLPHIGLMIMLVWGVSNLPQWSKSLALLRWTFVGLILVASGSMTALQVYRWLDTESLLKHSDELTNRNFRLQGALGRYFYKIRDLEQAKKYALKAMASCPAARRAGYQRLYITVLLDLKDFEAAAQAQKSLDNAEKDGE